MCISIEYVHVYSVSSVDLLSPEPPDAFSPPLTPSLTLPPSSFHDLTYPTDSSLISPPFSTLPKLSFEVTPYLHPKYLLADFALPRKKVRSTIMNLQYMYMYICVFIN